VAQVVPNNVLATGWPPTSPRTTQVPAAVHDAAASELTPGGGASWSHVPAIDLVTTIGVTTVLSGSPLRRSLPSARHHPSMQEVAASVTAEASPGVIHGNVCVVAAGCAASGSATAVDDNTTVAMTAASVPPTAVDLLMHAPREPLTGAAVFHAPALPNGPTRGRPVGTQSVARPW
jgi:hypothetical protein